jgi:hypothetical protein
MMQDHDEIIVFTQFDTGIEANIIRAKLDANDIPCFLTEENMAGLYPGQQALAFRIRLHIFKKDVEQVSNLLMEKQTDQTEIDCPRCCSRKIQREFPKGFSQRPLAALTVLFFGVFMPHKKVNHCLDCDCEF